MVPLADSYANKLRLEWLSGLRFSFYLPGSSLIALAGSLLVNLLWLSEQSAQPAPPPKKDVISIRHPRDHTELGWGTWGR